MPSELRVLVAEDNPDVLDTLGQLLEAERCRVTLCPDGVSALTQIAREPLHLILSDIVLPGASGLEILNRSSAMESWIPVVLISGYIDLEAALFAVRHGAFDYLLKPFHPDDIRELIRRVKSLHGLTETAMTAQGTRSLTQNVYRPQEVLIRKSRALQLIARSGKVLGETHEPGNLLETILELAMWGGGAEMGALLVASAGEERLRVVTSRGFGDSVRPGDEVGGVDELWALTDLASGPMSSVVPLTVQGRRIGMMVMAGRHDPGSLSMADREMLDILAQQASMALENTSLYAAVESSVFEGMRALVATLEAKDLYTEGHSLRVAETALQICHRMGLGSEIEDLLRYAGALHDVGKVGIPDAILRKPGKLTPEEYERMQEHPVVGWRILTPFTFLQEEAVIVRHHHEWMNGKGYPDGLQGSEIPLAARILAVADTYDAMTSPRPYRAPRGYEAAIVELRRCAGPQFDPDVVEALTSLSLRDLCASDAAFPRLDNAQPSS